jgi:Fe-S cluster assembly protein SufD
MSLTTVIERSRREKEAWKYTNLVPLTAQKFAPPVAKQKISAVQLPSIVKDADERHQIVFVNGAWQPNLSKLGELEGILKGDAKTGYSLRLAGQTCLVTAPVELVFLTDAGREAAEINMRLSIELGASGRLTLIEHYVTPNGTSPVAGVFETQINLGPQAKLVHGRVIDGHAETICLSQTNVEIAEGAYYDNFTFIKGGKLIRNEIDAMLTGKLAQCALNGVMLLRGTTHADTTTHINHAAPFGTSRETYKSVVAGKARGVFQGRVTVAQDAQKTDAQQLSRALLLSDQAEMDAKPELKIYADDVKCSHGAAVGALDDDMLFYLRARGLNEQAARNLLIRAFAAEIIDQIPMAEWRDYVRAQAEVWCDEQN